MSTDRVYRFRCFAYGREDHQYTAACVDLGLLVEADTLKESIDGLHEQMGMYIEAAFESGEEEKYIPRRAPLFIWKRYFFVSLVIRLQHLRRIPQRVLHLTGLEKFNCEYNPSSGRAFAQNHTHQ